ncbi:MAG: acetyltransferase [Candidatus Omnitrophica bacterium]|nr:acetyltransferase [Candidatus Omnitrophota bacterium]
MKNKIILIGGGGHCKVVIDAIDLSGKFDIYGIVDPALKKDSKVLGVTVIGKDDILPDIFKKVKYAFITVGSIGNCEIRKKIYSNLNKIGFKLPVIAHPKSVIAKDVIANIGEGTFIAAGAIVNPGIVIGKNAIINTKASVDHDCTIGDFVHIAPGVTLSGVVKVGNETHIGTGANIIQCVAIGKNCIIGAGITVRKDMKNGKKNIHNS